MKFKTSENRNTYSVQTNTPVGAMNIPDPIMVPIMIATPLKRVIFRFITTFSSPPPGCFSSPMETFY